MKPCCTDHDGKPKKKYKTREEAERVAQLRIDAGAAVRTYPCQDGDGWHLTSQSAPAPARPIRVITPQDQRIYTRHHRNQIGDFMSREALIQLKSDMQKNTLHTLAEEIEQLQLDIAEQAATIQRHRQEIEALRKKLQLELAELDDSRRNLASTWSEYERLQQRSEQN